MDTLSAFIVVLCTTFIGLFEIVESGSCSFPSDVTSQEWFHRLDHTSRVINAVYTYTFSENHLTVKLRYKGQIRNSFDTKCEDGIMVDDKYYFFWSSPKFGKECNYIAVGNYAAILVTQYFGVDTTASECSSNMGQNDGIVLPMYKQMYAGTKCNMRPGAYQLTYTDEFGTSCTRDAASSAIVTDNTIRVTSCVSGAATYSRPTRMILKCLDTFSGDVLDSGDNIIVAAAEFESKWQFYCIRYAESDGGIEMSLYVSTMTIGVKCPYGASATKAGAGYVQLSLKTQPPNLSKCHFPNGVKAQDWFHRLEHTSSDIGAYYTNTFSDNYMTVKLHYKGTIRSSFDTQCKDGSMIGDRYYFFWKSRKFGRECSYIVPGRYSSILITQRVVADTTAEECNSNMGQNDGILLPMHTSTTYAGTKCNLKPGVYQLTYTDVTGTSCISDYTSVATVTDNTIRVTSCASGPYSNMNLQCLETFNGDVLDSGDNILLVAAEKFSKWEFYCVRYSDTDSGIEISLYKDNTITTGVRCPYGASATTVGAGYVQLSLKKSNSSCTTPFGENVAHGETIQLTMGDVCGSCKCMRGKLSCKGVTCNPVIPTTPCKTPTGSLAFGESRTLRKGNFCMIERCAEKGITLQRC